MTETEADLLRRAALTPFEVVSVEEDSASPAGSVRLRLRADPEELEEGAVALLFALTALSFDEARPARMSDIAYEGDEDRWTAEDLLAHLEYRRGGLHTHLDYVRGRMLKTTIDVDAKGNIEVLVVNRGATARRWVDLLRGRRHLQVVGGEPDTRFFDSKDQPLRTLEDWQALHPVKHWREGRSAMRLAQSWSSANGFPETVAYVLGRNPRFEGLRLVKGVVEHECPVPGRGRSASVTDIMAFAEDAESNGVLVAVEGKVDEGFDLRIADWLVAGKGVGSAANRRDRVREMAITLGLDPDASTFGALRYQLVHRTFAAWQTARDAGVLTSVVLIHSFMNRRDPRSGSADLEAFLKALQPSFSLPGIRVPWRGPRLDGVDLWFVWVEER